MLKVKLLDPRAKAPTCSHPGEDLGYDVYALEGKRLMPGVPTSVRTGIAAHFGPAAGLGEFGLLLRDRSSMASSGIIVSGGVIDAGYRGEIKVILTNTKTSASLAYYEIEAGDKIAQLIPMPVFTDRAVCVVEDLPGAARGDAGFGSTGK